ncbi:HIT domain-containing protein [Clostridium sp. YIM B02515]|uniref:HIT domain-containing protein n=1 Tax=Clostridium rhizosphaerae TaxID=2803861 RepID=A0ABS1TDV0_9CLOT|nr:HIT domain-containing protein [Clostridium rhizosphaerae]MBL4936158.1 HIT domain-containing protein [Clostridium rhizosphaerae]
MTNDFYCEQVLSGNIEVNKAFETENVLAYYHTKPAYEKHIVVIPKKYISSLITISEEENALLLELLSVVKKVAADIVSEHGACRVITNLGDYQDSKHLHWHLVFGNRR